MGRMDNQRRGRPSDALLIGLLRQIFYRGLPIDACEKQAGQQLCRTRFDVLARLERGGIQIGRSQCDEAGAK